MEPSVLYVIIGTTFALVIGLDIYNWLRYNSLPSIEIKRRRVRSMVNMSVFIMGITLTFVSILFHINILRYRTPKPFSEINSITLKDFVGYKLPNETLDGSSEFAFIVTSNEVSKYNKEIVVSCMFHPSRSHVSNENQVNQFLLDHELYHFRISEYFARRLRKDLSTFETTPSDERLGNIISIHKLQENIMQHDYDAETYHSLIFKEQKRWEHHIDSLLLSLKKYTNVKVTYK